MALAQTHSCVWEKVLGVEITARKISKYNHTSIFKKIKNNQNEDMTSKGYEETSGMALFLWLPCKVTHEDLSSHIA